MPWKNFIFLILSILSFACLFMIGGAIAEHSTAGVILAIIGFIVFMAAGFTLKRKFNETAR